MVGRVVVFITTEVFWVNGDLTVVVGLRVAAVLGRSVPMVAVLVV